MHKIPLKFLFILPLDKSVLCNMSTNICSIVQFDTPLNVVFPYIPILLCIFTLINLHNMFSLCNMNKNKCSIHNLFTNCLQIVYKLFTIYLQFQVVLTL